jgi:hypothetical protein
MATMTTHLVLISKSGLVGNSLLSYCRSLVSHHFQTETMDPAKFLACPGEVSADGLIIVEEGNPAEVDQIVQAVCTSPFPAIIVVQDYYRQRALQMKTQLPVLLWGMIDQNLARFLFELEKNQDHA